jgi:phosphate transport system permease protein
MRKCVNAVGQALAAGLGTISIGLLVALVGLIVANGLPALRPEFFLTASRNFGAEGGVVYQIAGTLLVLVGAALVVLPLSIGTGLFTTYYLQARARRLTSSLIYALNGVPSIIFGLFGLAVYVQWLGLGISWLTGSLILGTMILPTLVAAFREALDRVPASRLEAGYAMGLSKAQVIFRVALPESAPGLLTGLLLSLARAAGETAPIMFTATVFSGISIPRSPLEPVSTLQTHILFLAQEANSAAALTNAWGASLVLLFIVFSMSGAAMWLRSASNEKG